MGCSLEFTPRPGAAILSLILPTDTPERRSPFGVGGEDFISMQAGDGGVLFFSLFFFFFCDMFGVNVAKPISKLPGSMQDQTPAPAPVRQAAGPAATGRDPGARCFLPRDRAPEPTAVRD